ncbi:ribulose-1,5-bisphosphate carboxylase small subunit [Clostridioides difficile]|nr:ribulose-1,5-bisphosphate carboxylase small subunit [Clostridioides difficile]
MEEEEEERRRRRVIMASSMMVSSAAVARASPAQTNMVAPFNGLRSSAAFPVTRKNADMSALPSNGGKVRCMQVWPPEGLKKFETLSYLPPLSTEALSKEVDYLIRNGWVPCIEFSKEGFVYREYHSSPGYYDGRYWTMWKLPMFGCTDSAQVIAEVEEVKKAYPEYFVRIIGFDNKRQVQCISFIAAKPAGA